MSYVLNTSKKRTHLMRGSKTPSSTKLKQKSKRKTESTSNTRTKHKSRTRTVKRDLVSSEYYKFAEPLLKNANEAIELKVGKQTLVYEGNNIDVIKINLAHSSGKNIIIIQKSFVNAVDKEGLVNVYNKINKAKYKATLIKHVANIYKIHPTINNILGNTDDLSVYSEYMDGDVFDLIVNKLGDTYPSRVDLGDRIMLMKKLFPSLVDNLHYLHKSSLAHHDYKPANVGFFKPKSTRARTVITKLIDLDSVCHKNDIEIDHKIGLGTMLYMSVADNINQTDKITNYTDFDFVKRQDIWALGMLVVDTLVADKNELVFGSILNSTKILDKLHKYSERLKTLVTFPAKFAKVKLKYDKLNQKIKTLEIAMMNRIAMMVGGNSLLFNFFSDTIQANDHTLPINQRRKSMSYIRTKYRNMFDVIKPSDIISLRIPTDDDMKTDLFDYLNNIMTAPIEQRDTMSAIELANNYGTSSNGGGRTKRTNRTKRTKNTVTSVKTKRYKTLKEKKLLERLNKTIKLF